MKHALTAPWSLTVIPHSLLRAWAHGHDGRFPQCAADLPSPAIPATLQGCVTVPASVPGNFELDLFRAGLLPDPFFDTHIIELRALEDRHLYYITTFDAPEDMPCTAATAADAASAPAAVLHFEGIDTFAEIYVNGQALVQTDNMFIPWEVPLTALKAKGNELMVHIRPAMLEAQKVTLPPHVGAFKYNYASLTARKAPSSYGWDILCRAVSGGIWRPVWLEVPAPLPRLEEVFLYTRDARPYQDPCRGDADLNLYYAFQVDQELTSDYEISVEGTCGDHHFAVRDDVWHTCGNLFIPVPNAYLWYPKNAGTPYLYDVTVTLWRAGVAVDSRTWRAGIRTVELDRTSVIAMDGQGEFRFLINHRPVFVMGTNWVPLDAFHSRDAERLPRALALLDEVGCNAVRCWGGNVYEDHAFFDFCDEKGIMVWQDFAMGCALYPMGSDMRAALATEVRAVVRKLRGHASLCLWAGDNECDLFWMMCHPPMRNPAKNLLTRKVIPEVLEEEDFTRPYLPSSPYIDDIAFQGKGQRPSEDHLWGPRDYFKGAFYRTASCHFASETGYHGCPSPASLAKFIPEDQLWPIFDQGTPENPFAGEPRPAWLAHQTSMELNQNNTFGYRISLMTSQVRHMFRDLPQNLDSFARMSQLSQAEAFKYFIERFRTAKWERTGIIWWNLLDGWPQVSDAVVGYDFETKLAYDFIKRAQAPVLLAFSDPDEDNREARMYTLHAINDTLEEQVLTYRITDVSLAAPVELAAGQVSVPAQGRTEAVCLPLGDRLDHVLRVEWTDAVGKTALSHFLAEPEHLDYRTYTQALRACGWENMFQGW